jgi:hypothetical protein
MTHSFDYTTGTVDGTTVVTSVSGKGNSSMTVTIR